MKISSILPLVTAVALSFGVAQAATIYSQAFVHNEELVSGFGNNTSLAYATVSTWTAFSSGGANLSGPTTYPNPNLISAIVVNVNDYVFIGNNTAQDKYALISGAGTIDPTAYAELTISFENNFTDDPTTGGMGWRVFAQVGSTIYASDLSIGAARTTTNVVVSDSVWHIWTGETNLSNGFNVALIDGGAGINLAAGSISNFGILAIDGASNGSPTANDRMRLYNYSITGTAIPEPSSAALLGLFVGFALLLRRRR